MSLPGESLTIACLALLRLTWRMGLIALGLNHQTAPLTLRERLAFAQDQLPSALQSAQRSLNTDGLVILSTCNRTELYALDLPASQLIEWLAHDRQIQPVELTPHLYEHHEQQAYQHLIRVASGLDSMVLGEPQILGQLKAAWQTSREAGLQGRGLGRVFEQVFSAAKQIRTETAIGHQPVTMGYAVVELIHQVFSQISRLTTLLIAAGEMNELIGRHLLTQGVNHLVIINRTPARAHDLALRLQALAPAARIEVRPWAALDTSLSQADVICSCTGSATPVLLEPQLKQALKQRRYQPMLLIDLAVPRDIDPAVSRLDEAYLYAVDDLQQVIAGNQAQRRQAAVEAEVLAARLAVKLIQQARGQAAGPYIQQYREQALQLAQREQAKALQSLQQGVPAEQVIARLANALTSKLVHQPSLVLRAAAELNDPQHLQWIREQLLGSASVDQDD